MSSEESLNFDILNFFKEIENQGDSDRIKSLRLLMDKYIHLNKADYLMEKFDFNEITSLAKREILEKNMPAKIKGSNMYLSENEVVNLCIIEATVTHLNKIGCLKRIPKFDYKE